MTLGEVLRAARAKITDRVHWTRGAYARDDCGNSVSVNSDKAFSWCSIGACQAVVNSRTEMQEAIDRLNEQAGPRLNIAYANDIGSHENVLAMFDRAIAVCGP